VDQTREAYDRAKDALEATVDTMARSFDALGQGTAALNRKIIEIAQENVSSGFVLAKSLATAKTLAEMVECGRLIGASSLVHSRLKQRVSARYQLRWQPTWPRQSRRM
jgi:Phasin protein